MWEWGREDVILSRASELGNRDKSFSQIGTATRAAASRRVRRRSPTPSLSRLVWVGAWDPYRARKEGKRGKRNGSDFLMKERRRSERVSGLQSERSGKLRSERGRKRENRNSRNKMQRDWLGNEYHLEREVFGGHTVICQFVANPSSFRMKSLVKPTNRTCSEEYLDS